MFARLRMCVVLAAFALPIVSSGAQKPAEALTPSQELLKKFSEDKTSVAYAAVHANLRNDVTARMKPGKKTELALVDDAKFSDGTVMKKGTVLSGEVVSSSLVDKTQPVGTLVVDWTTAELPKKQTETVAVMVRDARGSQAYQQTQRDFGQNQLGASSNSGKAGSKEVTGENLILMNKTVGMPQIAPGVQMVKQDRHSLSVVTQGEPIVIHEGTEFIAIVFKAAATAK